jgi:hypothetical protein
MTKHFGLSHCKDYLSRYAPLKYWIYAVIHELYEDLESLEDFITLLENFVRLTNANTELILPYKRSYAANRQSVLSLDWAGYTRNSLAQTKNPYLLVLPREISYFRPKSDDYAIIRFPNPTTDLQRHLDILFELADEINTKEHISDWKFIATAGTVTNGLVSHVINTSGGAIVTGDVTATEFVGRDKIVTVINIYLHSK